MILIQADFNHLDPQGRLRLSDLAMHQDTPFEEIASRTQRMLFMDGQDVVEGRLIDDAGSWLGEADWSTQQTIEPWPPATVLTR